MKKLLFSLIIILFSFPSYSQHKILSDSIPVFEGVITKTGTDKELYNLLNEWIVENFNSANDVIQLRDKERYKLMVKAKNFYKVKSVYKKYTAYVDFSLGYTLTLDAKNNRFKYKIQFTDIRDQQNVINGQIADIVNDSIKIVKMPYTGKKFKTRMIENQKSINKQHRCKMVEIKDIIVSQIKSIEINKNENW